jgi:hypothetical protein
MGGEIDSIFSTKKPQKSVSFRKSATSISKTPSPGLRTGRINSSEILKVKSGPSRKSKSKGSSSDPFALRVASGKLGADLTEEGWKIYTPEELNIGKGGDTELCPFDCNCCF